MTQTPSPLLEVEDVAIRFGGLQALDAVSFDVRRGEILALIGPNGAGKSTLLNVISGTLRPDRGRVRFKGEDVTGLPDHEINARGLARTFQAAEILTGLTVRENVMAAGVRGARSGFGAGLAGLGWKTGGAADLPRLAARHLEAVGLASMADASASQLTAGQQRLLAVARALASGAELLYLDEPGAGLNGTEKDMLAKAILNIRGRGITVVFVEHDLAFVGKLAERIVVLHHGRVLARGEAAEVRADPRVVAAYLGNTEIPAGLRGAAPSGQARTALALEKLSVRYGALEALVDVSLHVREGEIVSLIGANGAGKSTLLKAIVGQVRPHAGRLMFEQRDLSRVAPELRAGLGIALAPEGRSLFPSLSVEENLMMGFYPRVRRAGVLQLLAPRRETAEAMRRTMEEVTALFPRLAERLRQPAGTLSGGEGQMLAIGRALMSGPRLLMLDEPSFGLAPQVAREILESLPRLTERGLSILLIEQNARAALQVSDRGYVLVNGRLAAEDSSANLLRRDDIGDAYLGWNGEERRLSA
ncbi:ATP-binding cassette domain-containing protein [Pigmentiphaga sp. H8]|uniref:ATP-binding cassette domain-containing protein n=1 Tax=Pigmentiphaga sp. H8 TaxID=2488560 RepID=UPI000F5B5BC1|nr:ATP-binding cassette domain-containing protein [Pigmentiphaga sp. H8]AZG08812.1 ATP-binding cassette domain-containing protein [Pigmentiphaga sp. H8]